MANRKSAKDWRKAHANVLAKLNRVENRITMRLLELCERHPDIPVGTNENTIIKAKTIANINYLIELNIDAQIKYIEIIEEYLASLHPYKQLTLDLQVHAAAPAKINGNPHTWGSPITVNSKTSEDPICNCDVRDMPVYEDEGKRWCPQCGYQVN